MHECGALLNELLNDALHNALHITELIEKMGRVLLEHVQTEMPLFALSLP